MFDVEYVKSVVKEEISMLIMNRQERVDESVSLVATAAVLTAAAGYIGVTYVNFLKKIRNELIKKAIETEIPRAADQVREIARTIKMAKSSRDLEVAEKKISAFRTTIDSAISRADKVSVSDSELELHFNKEKSKAVFVKEYKTALEQFQKSFEQAVDTAYSKLDAGNE